MKTNVQVMFLYQVHLTPFLVIAFMIFFPDFALLITRAKDKPAVSEEE